MSKHDDREDATQTGPHSKLPGSDRRALRGNWFLAAVNVAALLAGWFVSWWWWVGIALLGTVLVLWVVTVFDARERGWAALDEVAEVVRRLCRERRS